MTIVDHATNFAYSHLVWGTTNAATVEAKDVYERVMHLYGHWVESYHADNSRFDSKKFKHLCDMAKQTHSYFGVEAHHQNGIAETRIKKLAHAPRTSILHAKWKGLGVITSALWPFSYKATKEQHNHLDLNEDGRLPAEDLLGHKEDLAAGNFHTYGCLVFVLDSTLQTGSIGPIKWDPRARVGVYLRHSSVHAGNIALVLNLQTSHVSPQYHIVFDDEFTTAPYLQLEESPPNWIKLVNNHSKMVTEENSSIAST